MHETTPARARVLAGNRECRRNAGGENTMVGVFRGVDRAEISDCVVEFVEKISASVDFLLKKFE